MNATVEYKPKPAMLAFRDPKSINFGKRFRENYEVDGDFLDSIKEKGVLQPISITYTDKLIAGGRRLTAALKLNLQQIPVLIRDTEDELDLRECELFENIHRKGLRWDESVLLTARIHELMFNKHGSKWTQRATAGILDRSVGGIHRHLDLARYLDKLPDLKKEGTEDAAVKKLRKMTESLVVSSMVGRHEDTAKAILEATSNTSTVTTETTPPVISKSPTKELESSGPEKAKPVDPRILNAVYAGNHYRIGDAFEGMQYIMDQKLTPPIHFVEIDPPYAIDLKSQKKGDENRALNRYEEVDAEKYPGFINKLCRMVYGITPENTRLIFWFGQEWYSMVRKNLEDAGFSVDPIPCIWAKPAGQTNSPERYLARCYESFFVATKGEGIPLRKRGRSNIFAFNPVAAQRKYHPTQRPVELMEEILQTFAWPRSIIMVPFMGSGVTLQAAYRQGMTGFGWDTNTENQPKFLAEVQGDIENLFDKPMKEEQVDLEELTGAPAFGQADPETDENYESDLEDDDDEDDESEEDEDDEDDEDDEEGLEEDDEEE